MAYKFSMTEDAVKKELKAIPATYSAFADKVQAVGIAAAEYGIVNRNGVYLAELYAAVPARYQDMLKQWLCSKALPFAMNAEKRRIAFSFKKAKGILAERGVEWNPEPEKLTQEDHNRLAELAAMAFGTLSALRWDDKLRRERAAKRDAVTVDDLKKSVERLRKKAEKAGVELSELGIGEVEQVAVEEVLPKDIQEVVNMLRPYSGNTSIITAVTLALSGAVKALKEKKAA